MTNSTTPKQPALRPELTPMPARMARNLLIDDRGYPIPWFVAYVDGKPEFRAADASKWLRAAKQKLCWVCGDRLGANMTFVAGPMCCITRTSSEPPSHLDCAQWSARNCPFLARPHMTRRGSEEVKEMGGWTAGHFIERNPGCTALWTTRGYKIWSLNPGTGEMLIRMGEPLSVEWYAEGRPATRAEIEASIESGLPALRALAEGDEEGLAELDRQAREFAARWLPS